MLRGRNNMTKNSNRMKDEMEEKLMEAKVFLSEARYTNINVNGVKEKIRKAVNMKNQENYEEAIKFSEESIEQANHILEMYDKLKSRKGKLIKLKENGNNINIQEGLRQVKRLTDQGEYKEANEKLKNISLKIDKEFKKNEEPDIGEIELENKIIKNIPSDGITVYSLKNELEDINDEDIDSILGNLENKGFVEIEKKGRWDKVNLIDEDETKEQYVNDQEGELEQEEKEFDRPIQDTFQLEINLDQNELETIKNIKENVFLANMDDETIEALGWNEGDKFFKDIILYAFNELKNSPSKLIEYNLLSNYKIFKQGIQDEHLKREIMIELDELEEVND